MRAAALWTAASPSVGAVSHARQFAACVRRLLPHVRSTATASTALAARHDERGCAAEEASQRVRVTRALCRGRGKPLAATARRSRARRSRRMALLRRITRCAACALPPCWTQAPPRSHFGRAGRRAASRICARTPLAAGRECRCRLSVVLCSSRCAWVRLIEPHVCWLCLFWGAGRRRGAAARRSWCSHA